VKKLLFAGIIFTAIFLRFWQLGSNPPSLTWDEVTWGYNAYSLGIDGRDEFGRFLPLDYLESFGDFKPPVYAYLAIIPVKLFGLNEFAVRFPSAFFGVLTVLATYFLVKTLFHLRGVHLATSEELKTENIALLSAFLLAISPWHIMLSRAAFEANVATFFIVLGVFLFLIAIRNNRWVLLISVISFVLSIYTFNTARVVAPVLILVLAFAFRKELLKQKKETLIVIILGLIFLLPVARFLTFPQASLRFKEVNIFSDTGVIGNANKQIENDNNAFWSKIIHNRRFVYGVSYLKHYFDNLNPGFLFIKGDGNPKFSTQTVGQMYLWELPFFVLGILYLIRKKEGYWWIVPMWLLVGIIPAGTARETPHALRIETTLPTFQILTAYGLYQILVGLKTYDSRLKNFMKGRLFVIFCLTSSILLLINFLYFFHGYLVHYPRIYSGEWQYGYRESIDFVKEKQNQYEKIEVTTALGRPYVYYLFYTKKDPHEFRKQAIVEREVFGFVNVRGFDKFRFMKKLEEEGGRNILYINTPSEVPKNARILRTFYLLNGNLSLVAYSL